MKSLDNSFSYRQNWTPLPRAATQAVAFRTTDVRLPVLPALDQLRQLGQQIQSLTESEEGMHSLQQSLQQAHQLGQGLLTNSPDATEYYPNHLVSNLVNGANATRLYWLYTLETQKAHLFRHCQRQALADIQRLLLHFSL